MSMDYQQFVYRPDAFIDTRGHSSYSKMHTWMRLAPAEHLYQPPTLTSLLPPQNGYDDFHTAAMQETQHQQKSAPLMRNGQVGSSWQHLKDVQTAKDGRQMVINENVNLHNYNTKTLRQSEPKSPRLDSPRRSRTSNTSRESHRSNRRASQRVYVLDPVEKIEKIDFEDLTARRGIEFNNWNLLR